MRLLSLQEASSWLGSTRAPVDNDGNVATVTGIPRDQGTSNTSLRHDLRAASFLSTCMTVVTHLIYTGVISILARFFFFGGGGGGGGDNFMHIHVVVDLFHRVS